MSYDIYDYTCSNMMCSVPTLHAMPVSLGEMKLHYRLQS